MSLTKLHNKIDKILKIRPIFPCVIATSQFICISTTSFSNYVTYFIVTTRIQRFQPTNNQQYPTKWEPKIHKRQMSLVENNTGLCTYKTQELSQMGVNDRSILCSSLILSSNNRVCLIFKLLFILWYIIFTVTFSR